LGAGVSKKAVDLDANSFEIVSIFAANGLTPAGAGDANRKYALSNRAVSLAVVAFGQAQNNEAALSDGLFST